MIHDDHTAAGDVDSIPLAPLGTLVENAIEGSF